MEPFLEVAFRLVAAGISRACRRPEPVATVAPTFWLSAAMVAVAAQAIVVMVGIVLMSRAAAALWDDDMMMFLGLILVPVVLVAIAFGVALLGWQVGVVRRLLAFDAFARVELIAAGVLGLLLAAYVTSAVGAAWDAMLVIPPIVALAVAAIPPAWRRAGTLRFRIDY